jgi:pimeloyl-ACP methyl ester carboxylesterase
VATVRTNGVELSYTTQGAGLDVLLIAPIAAAGAYWARQIPALVAHDFRVTTFDSRGVPPSEVPPPPYSVRDLVGDAAGLLEALDVAPSFVAGHSLGAVVAQELALERPDLVRAGALLGTLGRKDLTRRELGRRALADLSADTESRASDPVVRALTMFGRDVLSDDAWMQQYFAAVDHAPEADRTGVLGLQHASTAYDDRLAALAGVRVPCLVIGFEEDLLVPAALSREVAEAIPGAAYLELRRCGHGAPWERPDEVGDAMMSFFRSVAER